MEEWIMSSNEGKQTDKSLETVLDFLSHEIAATSEPAQGQQPQSDDIDSVISNLLKQVVRDSESVSESATHAVERNSIDSMLTGMIGQEELKSSSQGILEDAAFPADKLPDRTPKDIRATGKNNVRPFPAEKPPQQYVTSSFEAALPIPTPAEESSASVNVGPAPSEIQTSAPAAHVSKEAIKPARNSTMIIVFGCLAVVLVVAGSYFFTRQSGTELAAVETMPPVESADNPANAPVAVPAAVPATIVQHPTAATVVRDSSPTEKIASRATPPAAVETVTSFAAPAAIQVPAPPAEALPAFSLPALPQKQQPQVAAPVMISEPAPTPSRAPAKPKAAAVPQQSLVQAVAIQKVAPVYPELAKKFNIAGTVTLNIQISETGKVTEAAAVSGPEMLRSAALAAVRQWRFSPASLNGNNVSSNGTVSLVFNTPK
jgi:TonB family protein